MRRRQFPVALGLSIGAFICLPAMAATVEVVEGQVSVNQGQGYKQVAAASAVSAGDQVMAAPGSRGKIVYSDGCAVDVYPGAVVTVPQKCYQPMRAGLEPVVVEEVRPRGAWIPYALGAGVIAAGVCAITCDGDDAVVAASNPPKEARTVVTTTINIDIVTPTTNDDHGLATLRGGTSFGACFVGAMSIFVLSCD